ncbi:glycosyltransferase family 4 protein [Kaistella sp. G5-32]|uniref:Glycosyltransferase family 4 protein n=1 Tax=Kaistella gelatinilytica TaxID=2787636 RepID=A0ABS0FC22_9FLAO|nr:glycosyltransferase family 4 protein [Kaistella gelatinilytica]MBF8457263.1 glycosyltransferase family 4 protein [Kaistella gelatinilytica]
MKNFKIGYFCLQNPENKRVWSGTHYSLMKAIENANCEVVNLSPIIFPRSYHRLLTLYNKIHRLFSKKLINEEFTILSAIYSAIYFKKIIKNKEIDILFCPAASAQISLLPTKIPIIFFNDSTFDQLKNYYINFKYFSNYSLKISSLLQKLALRKSAKIIFCSSWASKFAIDHYHKLADKTIVYPLGANMMVPSFIPKKNDEGEISFLFAGLNWERKGGDLVVETLEILRNSGYRVILHCVGVKPPIQKDYILYHGFLDKNNPAEYNKLSKLYTESHFLFVPSRAECYGVVFSEASAYGLYSFATETGGIPSVIKQGINGSLFNLDSKPTDYADQIASILKKPESIEELSQSARKYYESTLDWSLFSEKFNRLCHQIVNKK